MNASRTWVSVSVAVGLLAGTASAVNIETVPVGNPGNAGELSGPGAGGWGLNGICGAVGYTYRIAKYEVTAGQYTEFLNAVAGTNTYRVYNTSMWGNTYGCKIHRSGSPGSYTYTVAPDWADRPVNFVSWGDAARFANWMHNGQPTGLQGPNTTEDGSYYLNGATTDEQLMAVTRKPNATWVIPTEDEWYKAAYHKNDGVTGNYWDYATGTDSEPGQDVTETTDPGNNANYSLYNGEHAIGSPYYRTPVGEFELSHSPYGTFDQAGNVQEWNETVLNGSERGVRDGSFYHYVSELRAALRIGDHPTGEGHTGGFRVAYVPEPATAGLLLAGGLLVGRWRQRKSRH